MGFIGICIDFFAWPLIALGYPMFASIIAIESGSKDHLRKLVIYWTLYSLISLTEFAFVRIIEWIPYWSTIKLIAIFWLVMPGFEGACDAYERLIRLFLFIDLQSVNDRFYNLKENKLSRTKIFSDIAEQFIKENGLEALEKLLASKHDSKEPDNSQRDVQVLEPEEKHVAAEAATTRHLEMPSWKEEWRSDLCNAHLQAQARIEEAKSKVGEGSQQESTKKKQDVVSTSRFKFWCNVCHVKLHNEIDLAAHLRGKRHLANIQDVVSTQQFRLQCNVCHAKLPGEIDMASHLRGKRHLANIQDVVST